MLKGIKRWDWERTRENEQRRITHTFLMELEKWLISWQWLWGRGEKKSANAEVHVGKLRKWFRQWWNCIESPGMPSVLVIFKMFCSVKKRKKDDALSQRDTSMLPFFSSQRRKCNPYRTSDVVLLCCITHEGPIEMHLNWKHKVLRDAS